MPLEIGFELVLMHILIAKKKRDIKGARLYKAFDNRSIIPDQLNFDKVIFCYSYSYSYSS